MSELQIQLAEETARYLPGAEVRGEVTWNLTSPIRELCLRLYWQTSGRGERDIGIVRSLNISSPQASGSAHFTFILPRGPFSFSGKLMKLSWHLEFYEPASGGLAVHRELELSLRA